MGAAGCRAQRPHLFLILPTAPTPLLTGRQLLGKVGGERGVDQDEAVQLAHGGGDRERGQALEKAEGVAP